MQRINGQLLPKLETSTRGPKLPDRIGLIGAAQLLKADF